MTVDTDIRQELADEWPKTVEGKIAEINDMAKWCRMVAYSDVALQLEAAAKALYQQIFPAPPPNDWTPDDILKREG